MPSAAKTSALPALEVMARLPCLATVTPVAAAMMATVVEMLNVPSLSPPVPQTSSISRLRVSVSTGTGKALSRSSFANAAISSGVSPLLASAVRKSALDSGVNASFVSPPIASCTCSTVSDSPLLKCLVKASNMCEIIRVIPVLGQAAFLILTFLHFSLSFFILSREKLVQA